MLMHIVEGGWREVQWVSGFLWWRALSVVAEE